jgi:hypothetical protein
MGGILFPRQSSTQQVNISEYIKNITAYQDLLLTRAYATQDATDSAHIARSSSNQSVTVFPIRSYVLVQPEKGPTDKLSPKLLGPYQIIEKYTRKQGDVYECQCDPDSMFLLIQLIWCFKNTESIVSGLNVKYYSLN